MLSRRFPAVAETFASFHTRNYRLFATGQLVSNTGGWVQRIAQDWLVLTITGSATAVGITTALQFLPTLLFGMYGGVIADRYDKRRVLLATNVAMSVLAAALAALTLAHTVSAWHVYLVAFVLGVVTAIDNPTRQSFVNEMVGPEQLRNAISLNASIFQLGALIGPAISGYLINAVGAGYSFAINAISYFAAIVALLRIDGTLLHRAAARRRHRRPVGRRCPLRLAASRRAVADRDGRRLRHVQHQPAGYPCRLCQIRVPLGAVRLRFADLGGGAGLGGGALVSARRGGTRLRALTGIGLVACAILTLAAASAAEWPYLLVLIAVGAGTLLFLTSANSTVQLAATDELRGRVMGLYLLVFIGSGAIGGPLLGAVDEHLGPRVGMLLAGLVPGMVMLLVALRLRRAARLRVRVRAGTPLIAVVSR